MGFTDEIEIIQKDIYNIIWIKVKLRDIREE